MRLGIIGAGFMAQVAHLPAFQSVAGCEIVAICDHRDDLRTQVADTFRIGRRPARIEDLLDIPDIDAVLISLPRRAMSAASALALASGKHVLSEKPMAYRLDDAQRLLAMQRAGQRHAVGYMKRFDPGVAMFRERLAHWREAGDMGEVVSARIEDYCATYGVPIPPHMRPPRAASGFRHPEWQLAPDHVPADRLVDYEYTLNVVSHDINLARFLFPETLVPTSFRVRSGRSQHAVLDAGSFSLSIEAGPSDLGVWRQVVDIVFQRGRARLTLPSPLDRQDCARASLRDRDGAREFLLPAQKRIWSFAAQAGAFVEAHESAAEMPTLAHESVQDLALIDSLWRIASWSP